MRVKGILLLMVLPVLVTAQEVNQLPDEALLEFLGSFKQTDDDLLDIAIDTVEQEQDKDTAQSIKPAEVSKHDPL